MAKTVIRVTINHHPATKAVTRILKLLDFSRDGYGVTSLEYEIEEVD